MTILQESSAQMSRIQTAESHRESLGLRVRHERGVMVVPGGVSPLPPLVCRGLSSADDRAI